jgi:hypothetical protein
MTTIFAYIQRVLSIRENSFLFALLPSRRKRFAKNVLNFGVKTFGIGKNFDYLPLNKYHFLMLKIILTIG